MTRQEIEQAYAVRHGLIASPGKFEGECVYVPAFWEETMHGCTKDLTFSDGETIYIVELTEEDRQVWPEIGTDTHALLLSESETGFVSCATASEERVDELRAECEAESREDDPFADPDESSEIVRALFGRTVAHEFS